MEIRRLSRGDAAAARGLLAMFGKAFDDPAIALYTGLGVREDVLHFDIPVRARRVIR